MKRGTPAGLGEDRRFMVRWVGQRSWARSLVVGVFRWACHKKSLSLLPPQEVSVWHTKGVGRLFIPRD